MQNSILKDLELLRREKERELASVVSAIRVLRGKPGGKGTRNLSPAAIANIRAAQKKRWAAWHRDQKEKAA